MSGEKRSAMDGRTGWRRWAREYATALMLTAGLVAAVPDGRVAQPIAVVRVRDRPRDDPFDPRERLDDGLILTVPATAHTGAPVTSPRSGFDLN